MQASAAGGLRTRVSRRFRGLATALLRRHARKADRRRSFFRGRATMNDLGVIDHFLDVFSLYIDSGFGLLGKEVSFLTATLVVIDITLAGLFWAMGGTDDLIARLIKKTLYIGTFAF